MKNRAAKRLLSWLMSAVMVVGEFGGMPLAVNAYEDTQIEESVEASEEGTEDVAVIDDAAKEAVIEEKDTGAVTEAPAEAADEVVTEEAQETDWAQVNYSPVNEAGVISWNIAAMGDSNSNYSGNDRYDGPEGKKYIQFSGYDYGVSRSPDKTSEEDEEIFWVGGIDLVDDNGTLYGNVETNRIIADMLIRYRNDKALPFETGNYYVYVKNYRTGKFSKGSETPISYRMLSSDDFPVQAGWVVYEGNYMRAGKTEDEGMLVSWEDDYREDYYSINGKYPSDEEIGNARPDTCPEGYELKNNYRVVIRGHQDAYIIRAKGSGKIIDRYFGDDPEEIYLYPGEGGMADAATTWMFIDNFEGIEVAGVDAETGKIGAFSTAFKMAPWDAEDRYIILNNEMTATETTVSFNAPEFTKEIRDNDIWTDDMGTESPDDDITYVYGFGYNAYVSLEGTDDEGLMYVWLGGIDSKTIRGESDVTYIDKNAVLIEMARMNIMDKFGFADGEYRVYITTGKDGKDFCYEDNFFVKFTNPSGNAMPTEIRYRSNRNWVKHNADGSLDFWNWIDGNDEYNRQEAEKQGYEECKGINLWAPDDAAIGYILETPANAIMYGDGNTGSYICVPVHPDEGRVQFHFDVAADFSYKDLKITRITATGTAAATLVADHDYDSLPVNVKNFKYDKEAGVFSWSALADTIRVRDDDRFEFEEGWYYGLIFSNKDDLDAAQDLWYGQSIEAVSGTDIEGSYSEIISAIVRDSFDGNTKLTPGRYTVAVVAGNWKQRPHEWVACSNEITIDLSGLAQENKEAAKAEALYHEWSTVIVRWVPRDNGGDWEHIEEYYRDDNNTEGEYWDLSDEERDEYLQNTNEALKAKGEAEFNDHDNLDVCLRTADEAAIGYVVKLPETNNFTYDPEDNKSKFESVRRWNESDPDHNLETGMFGLIEKPVDGVQVAAVYADGSVSAWNEGRAWQWQDEAVPDDKLVVSYDEKTGLITWSQKYKRDEDGKVVYDKESGDPIYKDDPGVQLVFDGGNGSWMPVYMPYYWDTEKNTASVKIGEVLIEMAYGRYHKGEDFVKGTYNLYILKSSEEGSTVSAVPVQISFDPSFTAEPDFEAFWWNMGETYVKVDDSSPWWKFYVEKTEKESTEGFDKVLKYKTGMKTANENIGGYLIKIEGCMLEPNYDEDDYASIYGGEEPEFECSTTAENYVTLDGEKKVQVAAVYRDGTISKWVDAQKGAKEIKVDTLPTNKQYVGSDLDLTGGKIAVTYPDSAEAVKVDMKDTEVTGYDKTKAGKQTLKISYAGRAVTFEAEVLDVVAEKIEIASLPTKKEYTVGEDLNPAGGKIKVIYNNGDTKTVDMTAAMLSGYDKNKAGEQTITVTYEKLTASFKLTVKAKPVDKEDEYEFDPTVQVEPVVGEGMRIFFDDESLVMDEQGVYHIAYTGKAIKPLVRVTDNRVILIEGVDYKVSYKNNKTVGTATVTVTGKGSYSANETLSFMIDKRSITEAEIGGLVATSASKVKPVVVYGGKVLGKKDYKCTVKDETVEIEGLGNFDGLVTENIEIVTAAELKKLTIKVKFSEDKPKEFIYDGTPQTVDEYLIVTDGSGDETGDYAVSYSDNVNAGTVTVMVIGTGGHKGKVKKTFKIKPNKAATFEVSYPSETEYNKNGAKPYIVVSANETFELLTQGRDYTVKYKNNKKGGVTASFTLKFNGNYKGAAYAGKTSFLVKKLSLDKAAENVSDNFVLAGDMVFNKSAKYQPKPYVVINGSLVPTKEYKLEYSETGKLSAPKDKLNVTASTKNKNYDNQISASYNVVEGKDKIDVTKAKIKFTESGKNKIFGGAGERVTLTPGSDYTIKIGSTSITNGEEIAANFDVFYADNKAVGKATIILRGNGSKYVGAFSGNFKIKKAIIKKKA